MRKAKLSDITPCFRFEPEIYVETDFIKEIGGRKFNFEFRKSYFFYDEGDVDAFVTGIWFMIELKYFRIRIWIDWLVGIKNM